MRVLKIHGPARAAVTTMERTAVIVAIAALLSATGCGTESASDKPVSASTASSEGVAATTGTSARKATPSPERDAEPRATSATGPTHRVRLVDKGCVQMEPQWASVEVGQSLEWKSELSRSVTLHVSGGAFDRTQFVIAPGATMRSGPARTRGSFRIWTEPASCQGVARGVQGPGPGVVIGEEMPH